MKLHPVSPAQLASLNGMLMACRELSACLVMKKSGVPPDGGPDPIEAWGRELTDLYAEYRQQRDREMSG